MAARVTWKNGLSFTATADSGFTLNLGGSPAVGGANDGFRPMELMSISLAGCTAMDVISILRKKRQDVTDFEVIVHADRAQEHPKIMTRAEIVYKVTGNQIDETAVQRAIELSSGRYCSAIATLIKAMPIDTRYEIYEASDQGDPSLVTVGTYAIPLAD
jgi:putative redox protein